jgi:site-specific DNA recombinase
VLAPDPGTAPVVLRIAKEIVSGKPANGVCRDLMADSIPSPSGAVTWRANSLIRIMRMPELTGLVTFKGGIVRGHDGLPLRREPVLDDHAFVDVQAATDLASRPRSGVRLGASLLLRVAFCGRCESPMYRSWKASDNRLLLRVQPCQPWRQLPRAAHGED